MITFFSIALFTKKIWASISLKCEVIHRDMPWEERIIQMVGICKGKSLQTIIRKLSLAVAIYCIWQERNNRYHDDSIRDSSYLLPVIMELIRSRLLASRGIQDNEENRSIQRRWSLSDCIFSWVALGGAHLESSDAGMLFNLIVSFLSGQSAWSI